VAAGTVGNVTTPFTSRVPIPVIVLVGVALLVLGLLLAQFVIGVIIGLVKLVLILATFAAFAAIGLYLWRRGDVGSRPRW
jgi:hypothetical protein